MNVFIKDKLPERHHHVTFTIKEQIIHFYNRLSHSGLRDEEFQLHSDMFQSD